MESVIWAAWVVFSGLSNSHFDTFRKKTNKKIDPKIEL